MRFPQAMDMTQSSTSGSAADNVLRCALAASMYTAVQSGARITSSISTASATVGGFLEIVAELQAQGYTVAYPDSTHITAAWS